MDFSNNSVIPIFPLSRVVFPDSLLRLQIFEQRYLKMVSEQLSKGEGFGVCLIKRGNEAGIPATPFTIGTYVEIVDFDQTESGLLKIICLGQRSFQINSLEILESNLLTANVSWLEPIDQKQVLDEQAELVNLLSDLSDHPQVEIIDDEQKWSQLGFVMDRLTEFMPISERQKQSILETTDIELRQAILFQMLNWIR
ncbi:LON peptidase substrate-binding domain-containing protein [Kangiella sp. HZ709]|uniref:LON peptidase substrate-binding domain-containing protein n=1 Tax=Kangiella sp. HZ709 TaxID=2666328 RepID=UPI0012AFEE3D|nr:LON peptidase substrate-binding domain-containing protein [Kangiella sp. HZ709]MRX27500.1 peptidase S16 [Kangiella sp. HZ709]